MYAKLGNIEYDGLLSFDGFDQKMSANYATHELVNNVPRLQKVGLRDLVEISLTFHFAIPFCDPKTEINRLRGLMNDGEILPLIDGTGESFGDFVITEITNKPKQTHPSDGTPTDTNVSVQLKEYVAPSTLGKKTPGFAKTSNSPNMVKLVPRQQSLASQIQFEQTNAIGQGVVTAQALTDAKKQPLKEASFLVKAGSALKKLQAAHAKMDAAITKFSQSVLDAQAAATNLLQSIKNAQQRIERTKKALEAAKRHAENALVAVQSGDIDGAILASNDLTTAHRRLRGANSETAYLTGARKGFR